MLSSVFELQNEICIFLEDEGSDLAYNFYWNKFLKKHVYFSDIMFLKLTDSEHISPTSGRQTFIRKLEMWQQQVNAGYVDFFENLKSFIEDKLQNRLMSCSALQKHFLRYFLVKDSKEYD